MIPRLFAAGLAIACAVVANGVGVANSQTVLSCPSENGIPQTGACSSNSNPTSVPSNLGGNRIASSECAKLLIDAIASLFAYDDAGCYSGSNNQIGTGTLQLKFVEDAIKLLPVNERRHISEASHSRGTLYCHAQSNTLILAFSGSLSIVPPGSLSGILNWISDWFDTNLLQHLGSRPTQYEFAEDTTDEVEWRWRSGVFDGGCGSGRPKLILAGHSKGGGQAQYAAASFELDAIVFNSDLVNPAVSYDWLQLPYAPEFLRALVAMGYGVQSICGTGRSGNVKQYVNYVTGGRIKDVRMVNDPLVKYLLPYCNLPHAPIGWLQNTLTCPDGGHAIETVIRELQVCASTGPPVPQP